MGLQKTLALSAVAAGIMLSLSGAQAAPLLSSSEPMTINASDLAAWSAAAQMRMRSRLTVSPTTKSLPTT
ncbi:TPA: hypothetical protein I8P18_000764 [Salmonella enterica subsp. enterica serovar Napoli]|nr:hypothetical protein [Salmonella enterica subsp. enterica serovar Napoli]